MDDATLDAVCVESNNSASALDYRKKETNPFGLIDS